MAGNFADGATTAAYTVLFNHLAHMGQDPERKLANTIKINTDINGEEGSSYSITLVGSWFGEGVGYSIGYFIDGGFFISKLVAEPGITNAHINLSFDITQYISHDDTKVQFEEIIGNDAVLTEDVLIGVSLSYARDQSFEYNPNFESPHHSVSYGLGISFGWGQYRSYTIKMSDYTKWLKKNIFKE